MSGPNSLRKRVGALELSAKSHAAGGGNAMALTDGERVKRLNALLKSPGPQHADARERAGELLALARARRDALRQAK
jgi:hypothetical protein